MRTGHERRENLLIILLIVLGALLAHRTVSHAASGDPGFPSGGTVYGVGYNRDRQVVRFRGGLTTADSNSVSTTLTAALAASPSEVFVLNGRQTLSVSARFATSSTNTCVVQVVWLYNDGTNYYVLGCSNRLTASATATQDRALPVAPSTGAGYFMASELFFDGHGATHALIFLTTAPTGGGAVDLWCGSQ